MLSMQTLAYLLQKMWGETRFCLLKQIKKVFDQSIKTIHQFENLGEDVPVNEQINTADKRRTNEVLELLEAQKSPEPAHTAKVSDVEKKSFDEERTKLYKQIDERVGCFS